MPSALAQSQMAQLTLYGGVSLISSLNLLKLDFIFSRPVLQRHSLLPSPYFLGYLPASAFFLRPHLSMLSQADSLFSLCGHALKALLICNAAHQTDSVACGKWHVAGHRCTQLTARRRSVVMSIRQFGRSSFTFTLSAAPLKLTITYRNMQQRSSSSSTAAATEAATTAVQVVGRRM